ncbi:hydroxyacid dehydrogenase [Bacillus sp. EB01]|uniref:hydroxyacid dehydrogenase n=1 Tax=Bacillus sp. EB01 TaxID=1347086 RepID=UPI0005C6EB88|nr:hydroxyacid dehydrogenase [Bacillus sp. EB01]
MNKPKVLIVQEIAQEGIEVLKDAGYEIVVPADPSEEALSKCVGDCEAILVRTSNITKKTIDAASSLKVIARHGVGTDNIDIEAVTARNIPVCNVPTSNSNAVAEHVVGLMLSLAHQINRADKALRNGRFEVRHTYTGTELSNKVLGLIGFGNIGRLVAHKCHHGLGMHVKVFDPYIKKTEEFNYVEVAGSLDELVAESDFVSLHLPYSPEMHHMINEEKFSKFKPTAYLVNCARGGLVDEAALHKALINNIIAGAALDVFEKEPPGNHPLFDLENIIVTPHMAAHTKESLINMATGAARSIIQVLSGEKPASCVNMDAIEGVKQ